MQTLNWNCTLPLTDDVFQVQRRSHLLRICVMGVGKVLLDTKNKGTHRLFGFFKKWIFEYSWPILIVPNITNTKTVKVWIGKVNYPVQTWKRHKAQLSHICKICSFLIYIERWEMVMQNWILMVWVYKHIQSSFLPQRKNKMQENGSRFI